MYTFFSTLCIYKTNCSTCWDKTENKIGNVSSLQQCIFPGGEAENKHISQHINKIISDGSKFYECRDRGAGHISLLEKVAFSSDMSGE